ncbi:MAG: GH3 auxin-responsive promoter family protein [Muribaculaceae bacterium]|nr:GH3 auxin-responsive promoter family protein [Muribaculaceae bacterium]
MNYTPLARTIFERIARRTDRWATDEERIQRDLLRSLLRRAQQTEPGQRYGFDAMSISEDPYADFKERVPLVEYEDIRRDVMRMIEGERDVLWPGRCLNFAQSSGTSGGRSKFVPVTDESLRRCHYKGSADCVAHYLRYNPKSRMFAGKGFILGGSFASELKPADPNVKIGDLSATLIENINPLANFFRVPDKWTALIPNWKRKLPALVKAAADQNITNISGVPSWFLTVIKEIMKKKGAEKISDVWPNLEVFFHGGISFEPYREEYQKITDPEKMHFLETYNASEGFFAVQNDPTDHSMLLIVDNDVFYEFIPVDDPAGEPLPLWEIEEGRVYELVITSSNGLWRYRLGDTVRISQVNPVKITIAGRTKCYINAFGEELMEENAEKAVAAVCAETGAGIVNYTAAPVFAEGNRRGRHQWLVEWDEAPEDTERFADLLDDALRKENSDYDAKRTGDIFLDRLELITVPTGTFDRWLRSVGNHKLGGQRKIPRLANDRRIADAIISQISGKE